MSHPRALLLVLALAVAQAQAGAVVVIGHPGTPRLDAATLEKIYTGKQIEVGGLPVTPVNAGAGNPLRSRFLQAVLRQDEEKYVAYWTVRRYIGKGAPPKELPGAAEIINFVSANPGAIGYIDEADLRPGLNVVLTK